jgi:hypothetical protein
LPVIVLFLICLPVMRLAPTALPVEGRLRPERYAFRLIS